VVRAPALSVFPFHALQDIAEPGVEIGKGLNPVLLAENGIAEFLVDDVFCNEIDQRVGLCVDVVLVEKDLGELENLAQSPRVRGDVVEQCLLVAEGVEGVTLGSVVREIPDVLERLRLDAELRRARRLIFRPFPVYRDSRDRGL
jgi:hypothetical protein